MASLFFDFDTFAANGGTQKDLDAFQEQIADRDRFFDLTTPDPEFSGFTVRSEDQLPDRPMEGKIEIARFFESLQFFVTDGQQRNRGTNGSTIYNDLKAHNLPVLGPNVGEFLHRNQHLIPVELQRKVTLVFWGKVYRNVGGIRYVYSLVWRKARWNWGYYWVDSDGWGTSGQAVLLRQ